MVYWNKEKFKTTVSNKNKIVFKINSMLLFLSCIYALGYGIIPKNHGVNERSLFVDKKSNLRSNFSSSEESSESNFEENLHRNWKKYNPKYY